MPAELNFWIIPLILTLVIVFGFPLVAGYIVLWERKVLADMQVRLGPMRVGPHGLLQPLADALKLVLKEDITPTESDRAVFWAAPVMAVVVALLSLAVIPFGPGLRVADPGVGVLFLAGTGALTVLALILAGWSANSHYPLLGALRAAAQLISYEVTLSICLLTAVMQGGSLRLSDLVTAQEQQGVWFAFANYGLMLLPFFLFAFAAVAEANRAPFDLPEAESEIVSGYHTEYSGFRFAMFMLAEYANLTLVSALAITLFLGGWLPPFPNVTWLRPVFAVLPVLLLLAGAAGCLWLMRRAEGPLWGRLILAAVALGLAGLGILLAVPFTASVVAGPFWFLLKLSVLLYVFIWLRGTLPRLRYDQLMNLGWERLIPLALFALAVNAVVALLLEGRK